MALNSAQVHRLRLWPHNNVASEVYYAYSELNWNITDHFTT